MTRPRLSPQPLPVLYSFRRCPYAMRARLALLASGERCELREILLRDKPADMLAASPKGTVPVLTLDDGTVIDQSLDIMLWTLSRNDPGGWLRPSYGTLDDALALIAECDGDFKAQLDRYKYPARYDAAEGLADGSAHRDRTMPFLDHLEDRLTRASNLAGDNASLADAALMPFVRQFAAVDPTWFGSQPRPRLRAWLDEWTGSALFIHAMHRYPHWTVGTTGEEFPPR
ncbi:glutathione S-transferase [Variovorax sp. PAMC28562]|uniref:glutathione S-transferase n=1 Tax=Variovorax sp. PAMC28562 TaxID=2762323 RepID=UPI00164D7C4A|nr:glutathione S-transferase [Variovorax sp. PAMC28562]QNK72164.1 glutathione S-transferase [Variovorax sp. PAMC28562]